MELKEYLEIIKKELELFIYIAAIIVLAVFAWFYLRPISYSTSLTLNISRQGTQNTDQFRYDDFYRLQADEKFAETLVQWLKDPRVVTDIYNRAGINTSAMSLRQLEKSFAPQKMSSQVVNVSFSSPDRKTAENVSKSIDDTISQFTNGLNKSQKEETWFGIVAQNPVIVRYQPVFSLVLSGSILAGIFLAFWMVLIKHYLE